MVWIDTVRQFALSCRAIALAYGIGFAASAVIAQTVSKGDAARGAARAAACAACHGAPDRAPVAATPSLAGQQQEFLVLQMFLFREGLRDVPQMAGMFKGLTDRDLTDVAAHFAGQKTLQRSGSRDAGRYARGAGLAKSMGCGSCHLSDYRGQNQVPRIVNQREDYLVAAMKAYRDNQRAGSDTSMNGVLYQVPDGDIQVLAHYLAHYQ